MNTVFKKSAAVALVAMSASFGAQAASFNWGVHDPIELRTRVLSAGHFEDTYSFSITDPAVMDYSFVGSLNIKKGSYSLLSMGGNNAIGGGDDTSLGSWTFNTATFFTPHLASLVSGNYYFDISGKVGKLGGGYVIGSAITPVPEPETYAMLIAGLSLMGVVARRRKQKSAYK